VRDPAPLAIELVTERLHLRPVRAEDAGVAAAIGADERRMYGHVVDSTLSSIP